MKRTILLLTTLIGAFLLIARSFSPETTAKVISPNKAGHGKEQTAPRPQPLPTPEAPVDIDGKRLPAGEKYVAQRALKTGRIIAYRQTKREVKALVKALAEDGVTDKKLLDRGYWLAVHCNFTGGKKCSGSCLNRPCQYAEPDLRGTNQTTRKLPPTPLGVCACS